MPIRKGMAAADMTTRALVTGLILAVSAGALDAQQRGDSGTKITTVPGRYQAGGLKESLLGSGWRDL
jgi:hypothetical protein